MGYYALYYNQTNFNLNYGIGNVGLGYYYLYVNSSGSSNFSDGRFKTGIDESVKGLYFIMLLRPVTYQMNVKAIYHLWGINPYGKNDSSMTVSMKSDIDESINSQRIQQYL